MEEPWRKASDKVLAAEVKRAAIRHFSYLFHPCLFASVGHMRHLDFCTPPVQGPGFMLAVIPTNNFQKDGVYFVRSDRQQLPDHYITSGP